MLIIYTDALKERNNKTFGLIGRHVLGTGKDDRIFLKQSNEVIEAGAQLKKLLYDTTKQFIKNLKNEDLPSEIQELAPLIEYEDEISDDRLKNYVSLLRRVLDGWENEDFIEDYWQRKEIKSFEHEIVLANAICQAGILSELVLSDIFEPQLMTVVGNPYWGHILNKVYLRKPTLYNELLFERRNEISNFFNLLMQEFSTVLLTTSEEIYHRGEIRKNAIYMLSVYGKDYFFVMKEEMKGQELIDWLSNGFEEAQVVYRKGR